MTTDLAKARDIQAARIEAAKTNKMRDILVREGLGENVAAIKGQIRAVNARAIVDSHANENALKNSMPDVLK